MSGEQKQEKVKVVWDLASELINEEKAINHFLESGFEPFGVTPEPRFNAIQKPGEPMQVLFRIWMKRPQIVPITEGEAQ